MSVVDEIETILSNRYSNELLHYGTPRHSGRYPWGSGDNPYQRTGSFSSRVKEMKKNGMTEKEIADELGLSINQLRARYSIDTNAAKADLWQQVHKLHDKGYTSPTEIGRMVGIPESTVRSLLAQETTRTDRNTELVNGLKAKINSTTYIDIGAGSELELGITETRLKNVTAMLEEEGYHVYTFKVPQATNPGKFTTMKVLAPPEATWSDVVHNKDRITTPKEHLCEIDGMTKLGMEYPESISSKRVAIRYAEEGGLEKDGLIELRPGVEDISLGGSHYAQVRIAVDGTHYLKGMAMYSNDLPDGIDILFNTNKKLGTPMMDDDPDAKQVLKHLKDDKDNPFGATIKAVVGQRHYIDPETGEEKLSVINKVNEEGDWGEWSKSLSSQFLSKQNLPLIKNQLNLAYLEKEDEFQDIMALPNPTIKRKLLQDFSDECDGAAVHLKAAALPRQASHVILPLTDIADNEIYAPNYDPGEEVILVRYPHEGVFQIPRLIVNNNCKQGKELLGNSKDAVGISAKAAEQLSGADFDGDSVLVIPTRGINVTATKPLPGLVGYDAKREYPEYDGMVRMTAEQKGKEMGKISNLITDMTFQGASEDELTRAVKYSQCVIDAEKHHLNYKQCFEDQDIAGLKIKYQGGKNRGASTLISKASSQAAVPETKDYVKIDPETGKKIFTETGSTYTVPKKNKKGEIVGEKTVKRTKKSTKMAEVDDAFELSSGTEQERYYAEYANKMKALANKARKALIGPGMKQKYNPSAKDIYKKEVDSLNKKLTDALLNAPRERQAQIYAQSVWLAKKQDNPDMSAKEKSRTKAQALEAGRAKYSSNKSAVRVVITPKEWEAIQAGAVTDTTLMKILNNTDIDALREMAMPRSTTTLSDAKQDRIRQMSNNGFTTKEIADTLGYSTTTIQQYL